MGLERRGRVRWSYSSKQLENRMMTTNMTDKPFMIDKRLVYEAYKAVRSSKGGAGVDGQTIEAFEADLEENLYKIWNRMSSGSYFPPPVRAVAIPKKSGGERILGVPTVSDRIAQMVVKQMIEPGLESIFLADSYGYRPGKSALDAVGVTRQRCWKYDWALEFDIKGLFDNISHELLLKAVCKHVKCKWAILYIERWLTAPMERDGDGIERDRGTPQGGVISPILSNLFMHYAFDLWMGREHHGLPWCRYADDGLVHCRSEQEAEAVKADLQARLAECHLEMHPTKTKIVYCKDGKRKGRYPNVTLDFLGYQFRPRVVKSSRNGELFCSFTPAVSPSSLKAIRSKVRDLNIRQITVRSLDDIARMLNPLLRGWIQYYGKYNPSALETMLRHVNLTLRGWVMRKFKRFQGRRVAAAIFLEKMVRLRSALFEHWRIGMIGAFA
jgi:RNA-directed DNA polymerase